MDERALRLEQIRIDLQVAERTADIQARRHVAVLAVGLTTSATTLGTAVLGLAPSAPAAVVTVGGAALVVSQVRSLVQLVETLEDSRTKAHLAIERLIQMEVEDDDDASAEA